ELTLRWELGSRAAPLLCAALAALEDAGTRELSALERKQRWYRQATQVSTRCGPDRAEVVIAGIDRHFDAGVSEVMSWLEGGGLTEAIWERAAARFLEERSRRQPHLLAAAVDQLAARGAESDYLAGASPATLRTATAASAAATLRALHRTR